MTVLSKDIEAALASAEKETQEVAFFSANATPREMKLANALLVLMSVVRLSLTTTDH